MVKQKTILDNMGRGGDLLFDPPVIKRGSSESAHLFVAGRDFSLPAQARDLFPSRDHLLLVDARNHLLGLWEESHGHILEDFGSLGGYAKETNYAAGNFAALLEGNDGPEVLFVHDLKTTGLEPTKVSLDEEGSYLVQALSRGVYLYNQDKNEMGSLFFDGPDRFLGKPSWHQLEDAVLAFSPGIDGALFFVEEGRDAVRPHYIDTDGQETVLPGTYPKGDFAGGNFLHTRQGSNFYFVENRPVIGGVSPLYFIEEGQEGNPRTVAYLKRGLRQIAAVGDALFVFYENGQMEILQDGERVREETLPQGRDQVLVESSLFFLPEEDYGKTLSGYEFNSQELKKMGIDPS